MRLILLLIFLALLLASCGGTKKISSRDSTAKEMGEEVVQEAMQYLGSPYAYGGVSRKGMDCSGLIYISYLAKGIHLPRTSNALAKVGQKVEVPDVLPGDLLFFNTDKKLSDIDHVGMVSKVEKEQISFIHSSSSGGVRESSFSGYWSVRFLGARRIYTE